MSDEVTPPDAESRVRGDAELGDELERAILRHRPHLTADDVAARAGVPEDQAKRLWRALGFPEQGDLPAYNDGDVEALSSLSAIVATGIVDLDLGVNLTRAVGQHMGRLAEWQVTALAQRIEQLQAEYPDESRSDKDAMGSTILDMVEAYQPQLEELMIYVWRRHLAASVARFAAVGDGEDAGHTAEVTVGFADIVSFTALSNDLSQQRIGDLVELFEARCADVVATNRGRLIKSMGDSVLFINADPVAAYDTTEGIINVVGRDSRMPDVRVGLASGTVVLRLGDVFGPAVNMAARLTAVARRNRVIIDQDTADRLPSSAFETRRLPARPVRGFGLVEPVAVRRA